jgi:hypothetical protein
MPAKYQLCRLPVCVVHTTSGFVTIRTLSVANIMTITKAITADNFETGRWKMNGHRQRSWDGGVGGGAGWTEADGDGGSEGGDGESAGAAPIWGGDSSS